MNTSVRQWLIDRARERSTWMGLTALAGLCGVQIAPEQVDACAGWQEHERSGHAVRPAFR